MQTLMALPTELSYLTLIKGFLLCLFSLYLWHILFYLDYEPYHP